MWKVSSAVGWPIQLTQSDERQTGATWSSDGKWIVFHQDVAGNEVWNVFAVPSDGGDTINLTNARDVREESPGCSPDGKSIALNIKPKEGTSYDIAALDWATRRVTNLTHEKSKSHSWASIAWNPNGKTIYSNRYDASYTDADVYAVDVAGISPLAHKW